MPPGNTIAPPYLTITVKPIESDDRFALSAVTTTGNLSGQEHVLGLLPSLADLSAALDDISDDMWSAGRFGPPRREDVARAQGQALWTLLPCLFKDFYRLLTVQDGDTIAIIGPPTPFPWELVWPDDRSVPLGLRRDMLGVTFAVTRWPTPNLPGGFGVSRLDAIAPQTAFNPAAPTVPLELPEGLNNEFTALQGLFPRNSSVGASESELKGLFAAPASRILHIAAHGSPQEIYLRDGPIRARDVTSPTFSLGTLTRPTLTFLNSCKVAGVQVAFDDDPSNWLQSSDFSAGATWADAFVAVNSSAVVLPMWKVNGPIAAEVSVSFYTKLRNGLTLGEAMRTERQNAVADTGIQDYHPTRFAYAVYGHPNATVCFCN